MRKGDGEKRTVRVSNEFGGVGGRGSGWEVSAAVTLSEDGKAEASIQGPIFQIDAEQTGDAIRLLQLAAEWAIGKRDELLAEHRAAQRKGGA